MSAEESEVESSETPDRNEDTGGNAASGDEKVPACSSTTVESVQENGNRQGRGRRSRRSRCFRRLRPVERARREERYAKRTLVCQCTVCLLDKVRALVGDNMASFVEQVYQTYDWKVPRHITKKPSKLPAIEAPLPGVSYNPTFDDHQVRCRFGCLHRSSRILCTIRI